MKLLDTNQLIELFTTTSDFLNYTKYDAISRISYIEFLSWEKFSDDEVELIKQILEEKFNIIELTEGIADLASRIRRNNKISLGDALILATAINENLELETKDIRLRKKFRALSN